MRKRSSGRFTGRKFEAWQRARTERRSRPGKRGASAERSGPGEKRTVSTKLGIISTRCSSGSPSRSRAVLPSAADGTVKASASSANLRSRRTSPAGASAGGTSVPWSVSTSGGAEPSSAARASAAAAAWGSA